MAPHLYIACIIVLLWTFVCTLITFVVALTSPSGWREVHPAHPFARRPKKAFDYWLQWLAVPVIWPYAALYAMGVIVRLAWGKRS